MLTGHLKNWLKGNWLLVLVVGVGLVLRLVGLQFGKPFRYHPDELKLVRQACCLLNYQELSKETFFFAGTYPPLLTYVLAIVYAIYSLLMVLVGQFPSFSAIKDMYYLDPFQYHYVGRLMVALIGTATLPLVYWVGAKLYSRFTGLLAALCLAGVFVHVRSSHFLTADVFVTFLAFTSFAFSVAVFKQGRLRFYILAAAFAGFATAAKYNAVIILLPLALAHIFAHVERGNVEWEELVGKRLALAAIVFTAAFLVACPLPLIDFKIFWGGLLGTARFEMNPHAKLGTGGGFWSYFTGDHSPGFGFFAESTLPKAMGWPMLLLVCGGLVFLLIRHKKEDFLLVAIPIVLYIVAGMLNYKAVRHLMIAVPFYAIVAGELVNATRFVMRAKLWKCVVALLLSTVALIPTLYKSIRYDFALAKTDTRTIAKDWIEQNLPEGTRLGLEEFAPPVLSAHDLRLALKERTGRYRRTYEVYGIVPDMFVQGGRATELVDCRDYILDNKIKYIVTDSFTGARFGWKHSKERQPEIVRARHQFYDWLEKNSRLLYEVTPTEPFGVSPIMRVYEIDQDLYGTVDSDMPTSVHSH